jgi:hypothetical protein
MVVPPDAADPPGWGAPALAVDVVEDPVDAIELVADVVRGD